MAKEICIPLVTNLVSILSLEEMAPEAGKAGMYRLVVSDVETGEVFTVSDASGLGRPRHNAWKSIEYGSTAVLKVVLSGRYLNLACMPTDSVIKSRGKGKLPIGIWKKSDWVKGDDGKWQKGESGSSASATGKEDKDY